jgi:hypothetical protein
LPAQLLRHPLGEVVGGSSATVCAASAVRRPLPSSVSTFRAHHWPATSAKSPNRVCPFTFPFVRVSVLSTTRRSVSISTRNSYPGLSLCVRISSARSFAIASSLGTMCE